MKLTKNHDTEGKHVQPLHFVPCCLFATASLHSNCVVGLSSSTIHPRDMCIT